MKLTLEALPSMKCKSKIKIEEERVEMENGIRPP